MAENKNHQEEQDLPVSKYAHKGFVITRTAKGMWYIDYAASRLDDSRTQFRTLAKAKAWIELITNVNSL